MNSGLKERQKTILVVDDEPTILLMMSEVLDTAGYASLIASNGDEAERLLDSEAVDMVLLDLMMPGRNGIELTEAIHAKQPDIPVIIITGYGKVEHAIQCFKRGATDFLPKPLSPEKLLSTIQRTLKAREPVQPSSMTPESMPKLPGYRFVKVLGEGNMGIVFQVQSGGGEEGAVRDFALKVLKIPLITDNETAHILRRRFMTEAKATFSIQHPNIMKIYDYGTDDEGIPFILMELFDGDPLDDMMDQRDLSLLEKCNILHQIAFALATVHDNDICHRDIKPGNVMVSKDLTAKVMDFGIARMRDSTLTPTCHVFGTPAFLSPEAFASAKVDYRSDIFSFGSLAYELFTGRRAFDADTIVGIAQQVRNQDPIWPRQIDRSFPKPLEDMLKKMLKKLPEDRYQSAFQIYEEIGKLIEGGLNSSGSFMDRIRDSGILG